MQREREREREREGGKERERARGREREREREREKSREEKRRIEKRVGRGTFILRACAHALLFLYRFVALPEFVNSNIAITAIVQSEVTLPCDIVPDPSVTFSWQFGGVLINPGTSGGTYTILSDGSLVVTNVQEVHEGRYTCVVTNPLGAASGTVVLTVNSKCAP